MAKKYLGEQIDIHAGGEDLIFPHHENEIAQSEAANGKPFASYWMHNAFLNIDSNGHVQKMSKSLGNFFTVREISERYDLQVLRFFMLSAHYRSPLNFSAELMEASKNGLERILTAADRLRDARKTALEKEKSGAGQEDENKAVKYVQEEQAHMAEAKGLAAKYEAAMEDDFNTADAAAAVFELVKLCNTTVSGESSLAYIDFMKELLDRLCNVLGIVTERKEELLDAEVEAMIEARQRARKARDFALADEIRGKLLDMGIVLEDTREGVKWKKA